MIRSSSATLLVSIVRCEGRGRPNRALLLHCELRNPNPGALCIADAWLDVRLAGGPVIGEGRLFHGLHNMVDPALVWSGNKESSLGEITIPLPPVVIEAIGAHRDGGDLLLRIESRVLLSKVAEGPAGLKSVLMAPTEGRFSSGIAGGPIEYRIPQSEWAMVLKQLEWSEVELVELPADLLRSEPRLARARERLLDAQNSLARGDWENVLANCRKAWEAAARGLTGEEDLQSALPRLKAHLGDGLKADRLNALVTDFGRFLHLGRHEQADAVSIDRADAILAVRVTTSLLSFLARR